MSRASTFGAHRDLGRCDRQGLADEVRAVTGHEIGHYVLGHIWRMVFVFAALGGAAFLLADRLFRASHGGSAAMPRSAIRAAFLSCFFFVAVRPVTLPITNTLIRIRARPTLFAQDRKPARCSPPRRQHRHRNLRPGAVEEMIYDHPGRTARARRDGIKAAPGPRPNEEGRHSTYRRLAELQPESGNRTGIWQHLPAVGRGGAVGAGRPMSG